MPKDILKLIPLKAHPLSILIPVFLFAASLAINANTFYSAFHFDDYAYIVTSSEIQSVRYCLVSLWHHFFRPDRMLVTLSFALNYHAHGLDLPGYHFINILFHALNSIMVYLVISAVLGILNNNNYREKILISSGLAALAFALHPVAVNSVSYITQRHGLMATFFYLLCIYCYFILRTQGKSSVRFIYMLLAACSFWAAIHCKQISLTLPLAIVFFELTLFSSNIRQLFYRIIYIGVPVLLGSLLIITIYALQSGLFSEKAELAGLQSDALWTPWQHFMTESIVFLHYIKILILPLPIWLSADHYFPIIQSLSSQVLLSWGIHLLIFGLAFIAYKKKFQLVALGVGFFYITLVPPYLVLPIQDVMVDYKTYLSSVGLMFIMADFGLYFLQKGRGVIYALCLMFIFPLSISATIDRNQVFKTEESLWSDVVEKYPNQPRPLNNRGLAHHKNGRYDLAIIDFKKAINVSPGYSLAYANIGDSYLAKNDFKAAKVYYQKYHELRPDDVSGVKRLANVFAQEGDWSQAVSYYEEALLIDPDDVDGSYNLGLGYAQLGLTENAFDILEGLLKIKPDHFRALTTLGSLYFMQREYEKSELLYTQSLEINPLYGDTLHNLAVLYYRLGKIDLASQYAHRLEEIDHRRSKEILDYISKNKSSR